MKKFYVRANVKGTDKRQQKGYSFPLFDSNNARMADSNGVLLNVIR